MRFGSPKIWISVISVVGVVYLVLGDVGRSPPGPLATVHARDPKLTGFGSCSQCHGGWTATMAESCLECHADIAEQIEAPKGLHGSMGEGLSQQCATCHSDHNGEGFAMVNDRSFAVAGIADRQGFDHSRVGFAMEGRHSELACDQCHTHAEAPVLATGTKRYLGLAQDCASCHDDAHQGQMSRRCADCHGQQAFPTLQAKNHDRFLKLIGGHAGISCRTCHAKDGPRALEKQGETKLQPRQCADCHESPHAAPFLAALGEQVGKPTKASCAECHTDQHTSFRDDTLLMTKAHHAATGFALDAPHQTATCADCHGGDDDDFRKRHPGRKPDDCRQCHQDPHGGQFDTGPFAATGCVACHDRQHFKPHAFDLTRHANTGFPLTGKHEKTDCNACHKQPDESKPRSFRPTAGTCESCHEDAHEGFFAEFQAQLAESGKGTCASCHRTTSFSELPQSGFEHGRFTAFDLRGAHTQVECEACHKRSETADTKRRSFGRLAELLGPVGKGGKSCGSCHDDPHQGSFDRPGLPATHQGRDGCVRCHSHDSFRSLPQRFDHKLWTGFPLTGSHEAVQCSDCHSPLRRPDKFGRTWGRAKGSRCADCHEDPHAGQFATVAKRGAPAQTDCVRCHRPSKNFRNLAFNHDIHSRFPLGDRHKGVACAKCHEPTREGGKEFVRYRPIARTCSACHGKQQDPFRRRGKSK